MEKCQDEVDPETPDRWPHKAILAQWIALATRWGPEKAMDSRFKSLFVRGKSVWDTAFSTMKDTEAFKDYFWDVIGHLKRQ